jgi:hypothetical protein
LELICIFTVIALLSIYAFDKGQALAMTYAPLPLLIWATAGSEPQDQVARF